MSVLLRLAVALAIAAIAIPAHAQVPKYPTKQVRVIVPYPAGGPTDVIARLIANHWSSALGQQFYVENVVGASGVLGATTAAKAPADGHTILFATNDLAVAPATTRNLAYDPVKDFAPISIVSASPQVIIVHPSVPAKTLKELTDYMKTNPSKQNYASMGLGFGQLSSVRLFKLGMGLDVARVPFSGAAPMMTSVIAGHTPIAFIGLPPAAPHIKAGKLRAIAVSGPGRSPVFPDVPTFAEAGIPGNEAELLIGAVTRAGTPKAIIDLLQREVAKAIVDPTVKQRLDALGFTGVASTPEAYAAQIKKDIEIWPQVIKDANIKVN